MGIEFTPHEGLALYHLLVGHGADVIVTTDGRGFIRRASPNAAQVGFPAAEELAGRHLADLVQPSHAAAVETAHTVVVGGRQETAWVEFPARRPGGGKPWFEMLMRSLSDDQGETCGALCVLRSIEEKHVLEDELFAAVMTDPLTGLTNRQAFVMMLQHLLDKRIGGCLAIFSIDYFKSMNMQYGQAFGDEVLVVFAGLLRNLMRADDTISRIGGETIGVLLPAASPDQAQAVCQRVIATLSEIRRAAGAGGIPITASVGVSRIETSLDDTIRRAELALFLARAKGRDRLEMEDGRALSGRPDWKSLSA